jgi:hypothetical protein
MDQYDLSNPYSNPKPAQTANYANNKHKINLSGEHSPPRLRASKDSPPIIEKKATAGSVLERHSNYLTLNIRLENSELIKTKSQEDIGK